MKQYLTAVDRARTRAWQREACWYHIEEGARSQVHASKGSAPKSEHLLQFYILTASLVLSQAWHGSMGNE